MKTCQHGASELVNTPHEQHSDIKNIENFVDIHHVLVLLMITYLLGELLCANMFDMLRLKHLSRAMLIHTSTSFVVLKGYVDGVTF